MLKNPLQKRGWRSGSNNSCTCLTSVRPWVKTSVTKKERKKSKFVHLKWVLDEIIFNIWLSSDQKLPLAYKIKFQIRAALKPSTFGRVDEEHEFWSQKDQIWILILFFTGHLSLNMFLVFFLELLRFELRAYILSHSTALLCDGLFQDRVSPTIWPVWLWTQSFWSLSAE
jgi:hypothetical protein